jgi:hypothetical protein
MVHVHGGSGAGATMTPEGQDNIKGEACLGCKRNSLLLEGQAETDRSRVRSWLKIS